MRFIIDTDKQAVIVPNSYNAQIDRLNKVLQAAGSPLTDYKQYLCDCFMTAVDTQIVCQNEAGKLHAEKKLNQDDAKL